MNSAPANASPTDVIRIGIVGLGVAGRAFIPAIKAHPRLRLVAVAEPVAEVRKSVTDEHDIAGYDTLEAMLRDAGLNAVCIATPTELHPEHVLQALAAGKHVLVEKPMAAQMDEARAMIAAADTAGLVLVVGHSHSYDLPIRRMREIIAGGTLGRVRMVNTWCFTDWIYRPRRADELDSSKGGGVTYRQGSHQFDIIRLLCGGMVRSVRARTFDWDRDRRAIGAHIAYLDFEDGAAATAIYNGYGHFSSMDLCFNVTEWGFVQAPESRTPARRPSSDVSAEAELQAKQQRAKHAIPGNAPYQPFFGLTVVSCERGDIRQLPTGLAIHSERGQTHIALPADRTPRDLVMAEFHDAVTGTAPALHDGRWGLANLEVCTATIHSSETGRDVLLKEQVPVRDWLPALIR
ncbi:MAG: Gfo/Idh/MocA family oxidoreductase [Betaproteobacteria bacterium]